MAALCPTSKRIIGLTGGIACGKSTVSHYLEQVHHLKIIDADRLAREAVALGSPLLESIQQRYGLQILNLQGDLDRAKLGTIIFTQPREREWLEHLIHPFVRTRLEQVRSDFLKQSSSDDGRRIALAQGTQKEQILVLEVPLLFEAQMEDLVTEIWVVCCSEREQRRRLMARDGLTDEASTARILSQWPLAEKQKRADVVLENKSDRKALFRQVDQALSKCGTSNYDVQP